MTKQQVIDILEAYKPSGNIYNGYDSIEEKVDKRICCLIDEIIEKVKREPDDDWIKCSKKMPDDMQYVLFHSIDDKSVWAGWYYKEFGEFYFGNGKWKHEYYVICWMPLPEIPKEDN